MASSIPSPVFSKRYGFSCKIWIAHQIEAQYFDGDYYVWFAGQLNPIGNGESSNPLMLYSTIDRAVKKDDVNHPKLKDLKANLLLAVSRKIGPKDRSLARRLRRDILRAPLGMYRPQLWKLDLSRVDVSRWKTTGAMPTWDEQFVTDLKEGEFEVIVE